MGYGHTGTAVPYRSHRSGGLTPSRVFGARRRSTGVFHGSHAGKRPTVRVDPFGNIIGWLEGSTSAPAVASGSHLDTVPDGGHYDGMVGCVAALAAIRRLKERGPLSKPLELAAVVGPFVLAVIFGSGDAATLAFNEAITVHAEQFGMTIIDMGSLATLGGCLGRTMSPLAGAAIICTSLAKVNPMEIAKRNALGTILTAAVSFIMLT